MNPAKSVVWLLGEERNLRRNVHDYEQGLTWRIRNNFIGHDDGDGVTPPPKEEVTKKRGTAR